MYTETDPLTTCEICRFFTCERYPGEFFRFAKEGIHVGIPALVAAECPHFDPKRRRQAWRH